LEVLKVVSNATPDLNLDLTTHLFGGCAIDATGQPLPDDTLSACMAADAILMGTYCPFPVILIYHIQVLLVVPNGVSGLFGLSKDS